jgi:hypothetical protein
VQKCSKMKGKGGLHPHIDRHDIGGFVRNHP